MLAGVTFVLFDGVRGQAGGTDTGLLVWCYALSLVHVIVYWLSLRGVLVFLRRSLPTQADIGKRMFSYLILSGLTVLTLSFFSRHLVSWLFPQMAMVGWGQASFAFEFIVSFTLGIMVAAIYESIYFFTKYRESEVALERMAKENTQSQLSVLKQQMNPHFLFNSLNTLVNIIPEDSRKATLFTQRLAAVYRRILEWRHKELITLADEVLAVQDYVFLMQTRFEDKLSVCWNWRDGARPQVQCEGEERGSVQLPTGLGHSTIVPLSIQLLVENAVKHNVVSSEHPLRIDITVTPDRITVSNPLHLRTDRQLDSTGWGHQNLRARYAMIADEEVVITQTEDRYEVSIPLFAARVRVRAATA